MSHGHAAFGISPPGYRIPDQTRLASATWSARAFYHHGLGLDIVVWSYPGALFMSAGSYHHHLGTNTWGAGGRGPREDEARLLEWELQLPSASDIAAAEVSLRAAGVDAREGRVVDPWGTALRLTT